MCTALVGRHSVLAVSDSAIYLGTAHNLLHGRGLTSPITLAFTDYFSPLATVRFHSAIPLTTLPPLYSCTLAFVEMFGVSALGAARVVGVASIATSAFLFGRITLRLTDDSWPTALAVLVAFGFAGPVLVNLAPGSWLLLGASALSESLFLAITSVTVVLAARFLRTGAGRDLVGLAVALAAAVLCRYLGATWGIAVAVLILGRRGWDVRTRLKRVVVLGVLSAAPLVLWKTLQTLLVGQGTNSVPLRYHAGVGGSIRAGVEGILGWFWDSHLSGVAADVALIVVAAFVVVMAWWVSRPGSAWAPKRAPGAASTPEVPTSTPASEVAASTPLSEPTPSSTDSGHDAHPEYLLAVLGAFLVAYLGAIAFSRMFLAVNIAYDVRFLAAARVLTMVILAVLLYRVLTADGRLRPAGRTACGLVVLAAVIGTTVPRASANRKLIAQGMPEPHANALVAATRSLPSDALVVTNSVDAVWWERGVPTIGFPIAFFVESDSRNTHVTRDIDEIAELLRRRHSYVVVFEPESSGTYVPLGAIEAKVPLRTVLTLPQGQILTAATPPAPAVSG